MATTTTISARAISSYASPVDLGVLPNSSMSQASDVNEDGVVVGVGYLPTRPNGPPPAAVSWPTVTSAPQRLDRGLAGAGGGSRALRINDRGQVLVFTSSHAFVMDPATGSSTEIVVPFASTPSLLEAGMNNHGDVVGSVIVRTVRDAEGQHAVSHAFLWTYTTRTAIDLGTLPGAESSRASAINDAGQIVGESGGHPFYWNPTTHTMRALDDRDGSASSVNNHAQAVGSAGGRAWVWDLDTGASTELDLQTRDSAGALRETPVDINDFGQVLGTSYYPQGTWSAWVWDPTAGKSVEVAAGSDVSAINDRAQVVGIANGHAALWNPRST
jgi:uncharacterized membrane protein